ncbi:Beta-ketoacyl synthase [Macrophomina phaseolina MS6]|uniref:Beta-ketoacyl synthase n=1 Tax=Macrophomina phaseolina (strain MS6) TaxID=1126212 RepID=K2RYY3_MACPH|nr:Beta-ketoacyl synthase [Macrophomina phaseolina MS6]
MGKPVHLLIFGDHASEKLPSIQDLVRQSKSSPNARRFLQEATDVVQLEYSKISNREHGWKGSFDSLLALAEENTGNPNGMLAAVLMCIGRLGKLIVYAENDPSVLGSTEDPVEVIGFCTGLLPAAAVLAARDTSDLLRLAPEIIRVTFRLAYEIWRRMKLVDDPYASWTETYIGLAPDRAQAILDEFHQSQVSAAGLFVLFRFPFSHAIQNTPTVRKVAIGIVAQNWLSLFGAPSSLARLRDWSPEIRSLPHLTTYGSGCVHTKYMPKIDAAKVLADSPILQFPIHHDKAKMACPRPSGRYESSTLGDLLGDVVNEIAHEVLSVDRTIECCVSRLDRARTVTIAALGPTSHEAALQKALKTAGIAHEMASCEASVGREGLRGGLDSIAIVGMAGRFPENETVEGFWQDLLAAKCHIKKVGAHAHTYTDTAPLPAWLALLLMLTSAINCAGSRKPV